MSRYINEIERDIRALNIDVEQKIKQLSQTEAMDPQFDKLVSEINDLRTQISAKRSRIDNYEKKGIHLPEIYTLR